MNAVRDASLLAVYTPVEPVFRHLFAALGQKHRLSALWPADTADALRWIGGTGRRSGMRLLPFWPWKAACPAPLRPWLRRLAAPVRTVILTRAEHAVLLPWFPHARKVYYALDDYRFYGATGDLGEAEILDVADLVVAVSDELGDVLSRRSERVRERLLVLPNAVPESLLPTGPAPRRDPSVKPVVSIVGRVSGRLRLDWLAEAAARTPSLHWQFAGGIEKEELLAEDLPHLKALERLGNCSITGPKPYEELGAYARAADVALLPYSARSVNPSACPMRLFLHLAHGQPLLATPGCIFLERFGPTVTMCRSADELVETLQTLAAKGFDDGLIEARRREGAKHTWRRRADTLLSRLAELGA